MDYLKRLILKQIDYTMDLLINKLFDLITQ